MERLIGGLQNYAWGSTTLLASLRGDGASVEPEAEIWYGAHHGAATMCDDGKSLLERIEEKPVEMLGASIVDRFGPKLPFLLKLLAADSPLSIQTHPSIEQAKAGFAAEEKAGVPLDAFHRSFRDDNHKPELICALTPFDALVGFRDAARTAAFFSSIGFESLMGQLRDSPKSVVEGLLNPEVWGASISDINEFIADLVEACRTYDGDEWAREAALIVRLDEKYPLDPGIGVAALLNFVTLEPGEALYLSAGHLHAYIGGLAVEVMANSDNVLRGGLTPKHIDVPNLLECVLDETHPAVRVEIDSDGRYLTPAPEFELRRLKPQEGTEVVGPSIVLCTEGTVEVSNCEDTIRLAPTEAVWLSVDERATVTGTASVAFLASVGAATTLVGG